MNRAITQIKPRLFLYKKVNEHIRAYLELMIGEIKFSAVLTMIFT